MKDWTEALENMRVLLLAYEKNGKKVSNGCELNGLNWVK